MRGMISVIVTLTVLAVQSESATTETFSARKGDLWLGGSLMFTSKGYLEEDYPRYTRFRLAPIFRSFPITRLFIGPKFAWSSQFFYGYKLHAVDLGGELGYAFPAAVLPYLLCGPHVTLYSDTHQSAKMVNIPISGGVIIPLAGNLGMQFELGYSLGFRDGTTSSVISVGLGVCGLGRTVAVSVLNSINAVSNDF